MTKQHTIIPQRHNGKTWAMAGEHNATGWLVVSPSGKSLARFASKALAKQYIRGQAKPPAASTKPGAPARSPRPARPVAQSLTRNAFNSLFPKEH